MTTPILAAGCMSGTSLDGLDVALVRITEEGDVLDADLLYFSNTPLDTALREQIRQCCDPTGSSVDKICSLNAALGAFTAQAVLRCCGEAGIPPHSLHFIASHGQTIYHIPQPQGGMVRSTLQIGDPAMIAYGSGVQVVSDFRTMDIAAGGQGAPLVPYTEYRLYRRHAPCALQNIGGIANVTVLPHPNCTPEEVFAFDTGPGNMVIDALAKQLLGLDYDPAGQHAAQGCVDETLLAQLLNMDYIRAQPPKTTGRELFGDAFAAQLISQNGHRSPQDLLATATAFTARSIAENYRDFVFPTCPHPAIIVGGGGAYNQTLLAMLRAELPGHTVCTQEDLGYSSDAKEAIAFAVLGYETLCGRPSNLPRVTGAERCVLLGNITPALLLGKV